MPTLTKWFKPAPLHQPAPRAVTDLLDPKAIAAYRQVARSVGVSDAALDIEEFRLFLDQHDLPVFNRGEVIRYMDQVAQRDNPTGWGWHWAPVREKDAKIGLTFGTPSEQAERMAPAGNRAGATVTSRSPASDYYSDKTRPYARILPLHVLMKIALIERSFHPDKVRFLVSDYTLAPHVVLRPAPLPPPVNVNPDPFLMAVVPSGGDHTLSAFVIDVWDEPGFGLQQRLTPADSGRLVVR
jgi:hypothetical protein